MNKFIFNFDYETLDKHFTSPKNKVKYKRLPRKYKKKLNRFILEGNNLNLLRAKYYDLNTKMWYLRWFINPDYNRFLIKKTCENKNSGNWN